MKNELLHGFRLGKAERRLDIHGIEVRQHGEIIAKHHWRAQYRECVFSVSKSFTSAALGIALNEGLLSLDDKIVDLFPECVPEKPDEKLGLLTVKMSMMMANGHAECPIFRARRENPTCEDWLSDILSQPLAYQPGTHFLYSNVSGYFISAAIQKKTGKTLRDYLIPRLFEPLHIFNPQWESCPKGINLGASGLYLTTEELSRFGQLLLDNGRFEGRQVVPADYIAMAASRQIDNDNGSTADPEAVAGYGFQFWRNSIPNSYRADGLYGQYIIVLPDYDAVVTVTSHVEENQHNILRLVWDELLPELEKRR